jgi:outer membrane protein assembly factor BamB
MGNRNNTDTIFCLEAGTGKAVWDHSYPCPLEPKNFEGGPCATPTVADDRVYTFSRKGDLFCLDAAKGDVIWSKNLNRELGLEIPTWGCASSALVEGNLVVVNMGSAGVALDRKSGKVVWVSDKSPGAYATAVPLTIGGDRCLAILTRQSLVAVKAAGGQGVWSYPWKTEYDVNAADPVVDGDKVFISGGYNHGGAVLKVSGQAPEKVWENKNMRNHFNTCVLWQGYLYGPDDSGLRCLAFDTGDLKWTYGEFGKGPERKGRADHRRARTRRVQAPFPRQDPHGEVLDHAGVVQRPYLLPQRGRRRGVRGRERELTAKAT